MLYDLAIVGAGPAGLAAAIQARLAGMTCVVIEKGVRPLDKACGEGLMPAGVEALARLGISTTDIQHRPFRGIRYVTENTVAEGFFQGHGIGVRRTELIDNLALRAHDLGAELWFGVPVRSWKQQSDRVEVTTSVTDVSASYLAAADGLHSRTRQKEGMTRKQGGRARYGVRRHYAVAPWSDLVEVHWARDIEAYVTPIRDDEIGIAILCPGDGRSFDELLDQFPVLQERLRGSEQVGSDRGAGPLRQAAKRLTKGRIALIGDAAGYVDAITGEGVTLALESAASLVATLSSGQPIGSYERQYFRLSRTYRYLTLALLRATSCPLTRRRIVRSLARSPEAFSRFVQVAAGERRWSELGLGTTMRVAAGMLF